MVRNWGFCRINILRTGHENSESLFDRFFDWNCGWVGVMGVRLGQIIWPAHPQMAGFLLTLVTAIVIQIAWPRLTVTRSP
jgi:hypothetical protein